MPRLIDTHCHVNLYADIPAVVAEIEQTSMQVVMVTNEPAAFEQNTIRSDCIHTALGLLPHEISRLAPELDRFLELLDGTRHVGEIGLDYVTQDEEQRRLQRSVFEKILAACAESGDKILSIHSRRASADVVRMLGTYFPGKAILHWFSGSVADVEAAEGIYFSLNTAMIRSRSAKKLIRAMNPDFILTETDGPFVEVDERSARPNDVKRVVNWLAQEWGTSFEEAADRVWTNWIRS
jgi:TatD DNase family protein